MTSLTRKLSYSSQHIYYIYIEIIDPFCYKNINLKLIRYNKFYIKLTQAQL